MAGIVIRATAAGLMGVLAAGPALAQAQQDNGARQVVGLFAQTCVRFAGDPGAVRAMLNQRGVPPLSPAARAVFMGDRSGVGFDASTGATRLALVSEDNGSCTAFAGKADATQVLQLLEAQLRLARANPQLIGDHGDARDPTLHHRDYTVVEGGRPFSLVVSTSSAAGRIQAMLTLSPEAAAQRP